MTDPIEEARDFLRTLDPSHDTIDRIFAPVVDECERLRAELAEVTAERDDAASESMLWQSRWVAEHDAAESALAKVTAERDLARDLSFKRFERLSASNNKLIATQRELAAVTAERDEAVKQQRHAWERAAEKDRAYGDMIDQRDAAEAALARAMEAMPTVHESETLRNALEYDAKAGGLTIGRYEPWASASAALDRLDAFRAGQAKATGQGECCIKCGLPFRHGPNDGGGLDCIPCQTGTGRAKGGEHGE